MMRLKLILIAALVFSIPAISTALDAKDEFDSLNREDLKALFAEPKLAKGFLTGKYLEMPITKIRKGNFVHGLMRTAKAGEWLSFIQTEEVMVNFSIHGELVPSCI